jgi:hypothetical protein
MAGMRPEKKPDESWSYPCSKDVLEAAGLQTIAHYMGMRRQTVTNFIVNRLIWELCMGAVRRRGSPIQPFWWDQLMDLAWQKRGACSSLRRALRTLHTLKMKMRTEAWYGTKCKLNISF